MDTSTRVVYGVLIIVIALLIVTSNAFMSPYFAIVATILFVLGGVFTILLLNPFAKIPKDEHERKIYELQQKYQARAGEDALLRSAERKDWQQQLAAERAQKRRYITLWRKAKRDMK